MNRKMFKTERQLSAEDTIKLLASGTEGTLCLNGDEGYPYGSPMNYVYFNDAIYFHGALYGYKYDAIKGDSKACFSAIIRSQVAPELFTTRFESVIAFGNVELVENPEERQQVMEKFIQVFSPDFIDGGMKFIKGALGKTSVIKMTIKEIKGKAFRNDKW
ncbi:MAG: pyridoxamine 5'-phosphate oxidase family protein [Anaerovoracaceae bacterium]